MPLFPGEDAQKERMPRPVVSPAWSIAAASGTRIRRSYPALLLISPPRGEPSRAGADRPSVGVPAPVPVPASVPGSLRKPARERRPALWASFPRQSVIIAAGMGNDSESLDPASSPYKPRAILAGRYQVRRELG